VQEKSEISERITPFYLKTHKIMHTMRALITICFLSLALVAEAQTTNFDKFRQQQDAKFDKFKTDS